jgi:hypothetical protein
LLSLHEPVFEREAQLPWIRRNRLGADIAEKALAAGGASDLGRLVPVVLDEIPLLASAPTGDGSRIP